MHTGSIPKGRFRVVKLDKHLCLIAKAAPALCCTYCNTLEMTTCTLQIRLHCILCFENRCSFPSCDANCICSLSKVLLSVLSKQAVQLVAETPQ